MLNPKLKARNDWWQRFTKRPHTSPRAEPYQVGESDPAYKDQLKMTSVKYIKVLTKFEPRRIIRRARKAKRKDDNMASGKTKNIIRHTCLAILVIAAVEGIATFLGGSLKDCLIAALLSGALYIGVIDFQ